MQRRAATAYVVFFLIVGGASLGLVVTAEPPAVEFPDPEHSLGSGDRFSVDGREYTVTEVTAERSEGEVVRSATAAWRDRSARYTETWEENATVTIDGEERRVALGGDPPTLSLAETQNRTAILRADPRADNQTVTRDGEAFVVLTEDGTARLVPAADYFPAVNTTTYREGDEFQYRDNATTVESVSGSNARLAWTAPRTERVDLAAETNVTLNGRTFFVYVPDNSTVLLEREYGVYARQVAEREQFVRHRNGFTGVAVLSVGVAVLLVGMAFLPSRY